MVGCFSGDIPFYIDVWAGGKMIELEDSETMWAYRLKSLPEAFFFL